MLVRIVSSSYAVALTILDDVAVVATASLKALLCAFLPSSLFIPLQGKIAK